MKHAAENHVTDYAVLSSPVGNLLIGGDGRDVTLIGFSQGIRAITPRSDWRHNDSLYVEARSQLTDYFAGLRRTFNFPMMMIGTDFQKAVWVELLRVPWGKTRAYRDLARDIGRPKAIRAVGAANGANPLPIVVPCHRLCSADGSLNKYGGGLDAKRFLLNLELGRTGW
jgi:methylated-DNA-[protein]-cysteine S-methyltransferase